MKNKESFELRKRYESQVKEICDRCNKEISIAKEIYLETKRKAHRDRDNEITVVKNEVYG